jgi:hypothetical protein
MSGDLRKETMMARWNKAAMFGLTAALGAGGCASGTQADTPPDVASCESKIESRPVEQLTQAEYAYAMRRMQSECNEPTRNYRLR